VIRVGWERQLKATKKIKKKGGREGVKIQCEIFTRTGGRLLFWGESGGRTKRGGGKRGTVGNKDLHQTHSAIFLGGDHIKKLSQWKSQKNLSGTGVVARPLAAALLLLGCGRAGGAGSFSNTWSTNWRTTMRRGEKKKRRKS